MVLSRPYTELSRRGTITTRILCRPENNMQLTVNNDINRSQSSCKENLNLSSLERLQATCFRLASLIFRTCLCCVYSLSFPGHFGNSNPSLSLITHTTHSTSGLGLPEWLICRAFYCSHIVGVVNDCVAVYCFLLWGAHSILTSDVER